MSAEIHVFQMLATAIGDLSLLVMLFGSFALLVSGCFKRPARVPPRPTVRDWEARGQVAAESHPRLVDVRELERIWQLEDARFAGRAPLRVVDGGKKEAPTGFRAGRRSTHYRNGGDHGPTAV